MNLLSHYNTVALFSFLSFYSVSALLHHSAYVSTGHLIALALRAGIQGTTTTSKARLRETNIVVLIIVVEGERHGAAKAKALFLLFVQD